MGMATMAAFSVQGACGLSVNQSCVSDCRDAGIWIRTRRDIGMRSSSSSRRELEDGKQRCLFTRRIGGCGGIRCVASEPKVKTSVDDNEESVIPSVANPTSRDATAIASNIKYHAEYTPSYSPYKFELEQAYVATAESLRDTLVQRWNETYKHFQLDNAKAIHYLSMEFLQGRALLNAIGNLEVKDAYSQALQRLGHDLEAVAEKVNHALL
jgi:hypothetical protein